MPIQGKIIANKPGHKINVNFAKEILGLIKERKKSKKMTFLSRVGMLWTPNWLSPKLRCFWLSLMQMEILSIESQLHTKKVFIG